MKYSHRHHCIVLYSCLSHKKKIRCTDLVYCCLQLWYLKSPMTQRFPLYILGDGNTSTKVSSPFCNILHATIHTGLSFYCKKDWFDLGFIYFFFFSTTVPLFCCKLVSENLKKTSPQLLQSFLSLLQLIFSPNSQKVTQVFGSSFGSTKNSNNQRNSIVPGLCPVNLSKAEPFGSHYFKNLLSDKITLLPFWALWRLLSVSI